MKIIIVATGFSTAALNAAIAGYFESRKKR